MEWPAVAALASVAIAVCAVIGFWLNLSDRIGKGRAVADAAKAKADDAAKLVHEMQTQLAATNAAFSLYREQVAREYVDRKVMREVEERLVGSIDRLGERIDRALEVRGHPRRS